MTEASADRQVWVEPVMGTVVSIDVRPPLVDPAVLDEVVAWFHDVDARFSPCRPDSEVSRVGGGSLALDEASPDVRAMFTLADDLHARTGGFFDPRAHRPDGRPDPTGVVKGWSVDEAVATLRLAGARNLQVGAGGDLVALGEAAPGRAWRIGIRHPDRADRVVAVVRVRDLAVATSGSYERGAHIIDPGTGMAAQGLRSLTVIGPTLALADAYATAGFAMGEAGIAWVGGQDGFGAIAINDANRLVWTPVADALLDDVSRGSPSASAFSGRSQAGPVQ
jgi:thiamine biosynthesis lipoprotein